MSNIFFDEELEKLKKITDETKNFVVAPDWDEQKDMVMRSIKDYDKSEDGVYVGIPKDQYEIFLENQLAMLTKELDRVVQIRSLKDKENAERNKKLSTGKSVFANECIGTIEVEGK